MTGPVAFGTRLFVVLEVQPFEDIGARLMVDNPLPWIGSRSRRPRMSNFAPTGFWQRLITTGFTLSALPMLCGLYRRMNVTISQL